MKRIIALLAVLIMAISLTACVKTEVYPLVGKWKIPINDLGIYSTAYDESVYTVFEIKDDGTIHAVNIGLGIAPYPDDFSYVVDGDAIIITGEDGSVDECSYKINGSSLIIESADQKLEFTRIIE